MEQNLTVVLKKAVEPTPTPTPTPTPEPSIPVPNTGSFTNTTISNIASGASILFMLAFIICFVIYYAKKNNLAKLLAKIFTITAITTFILSGVLQTGVNADNGNNDLSFEDFYLEVEPGAEDTFAYGKSEIKVKEPTSYGYTLTAYTTTPDLLHTEDNLQKINSLNNSDITNPTILNTNTWGFSQSTPQDITSPVWNSLPSLQTEAIVLKDTDSATEANDTTELYFGVDVNDTLEEGSYKGKVVYNLTIKPEPAKLAYLDTGENINKKMKNLANNITYATIYTSDTKITTIARANSLPTGFALSTNNIISLFSSPNPVYIFFDDTTGTMYYYTEANDIVLNSDSSNMFRNLTSLTNIDTLADWDTSSVTDISWMFIGATSLTNIDGASNWDTSSVTNMFGMFYGASALANIDGASNWDTSSVTDMSSMFDSVSSLTNIDTLENWDTSSVTGMEDMFYGASALANIDGASNWDTSSVITMSNMFHNTTSLTNIDGASNWDTSSVITMSDMFSYASSLTNIDGASNWDTSSVTDMAFMFAYASSLTNINGARNWNTGNVTNINHMFNNVNNIDATLLNGWDVSKVTYKTNTFTCPANKRPSWY